MRNKTKEEILKEELLKFIPQKYGDIKMTSKEFDNHMIKDKRIFDLFLNAMEVYANQCQETLTTRILELESQIESLTNVVVSECSCKCDDCEYFNNILTPKKPYQNEK